MKTCSIIAVVVALSALVCAQDQHSLLSSDLVAWSAMQQPTAPEQNQTRQQPTPDPTPESQPAPNPNKQPSPNQSSSAAQNQAPSADTFTGTVSKESDGFALKVSDTTSYKLDNQQQVQQYVGQRVRVTGTLERSLNLIHVDRIEPMS